MVVTGWLLRRAARHPRPFLVSAADGTRARLRCEAEIARRRWRPALSPAEAGLLVVCGAPGDELSEAVRTIWDGLPSPRARADLPGDASHDLVAHALDRAVARLADGAAPGRPHGGPDPGDLPMADRGPDRDGLSLDRLHVPLGPVLPDWPSGLVVETVLQGDVIQEATVRWLEDGEPFWAEPWDRAAAGRPVTRGEAGRRRAAAHLDGLGRLLSVAGWPAAARSARTVRDRLLADAPREALTAPYERLARQVRRSGTLRWMLRGVGPAGDGDALARLEARLTATRAAIGSIADEAPLDEDRPAGNLLNPDLLVGAELATARLMVASLDPGPAVAHA
ncbi:unnamed protein product [[Actinomadura] parvosata subsp. kistnae]|uniref:Uncharacterized protein n=1 Tax=[Actinomadura] parvosata subsp. kistnae TaxID=1909395 RepID=A0A1V0A016_9ACTN|nr:hypothetical protein [Nonomuraea sp. ATCC 55076]AQZ63533.1 hypothetical protein BKM31_20570 [Nonomuraea sp. ATCC 55076]SPL99288.1 unnamed protein product [Actinomadura parvosata subsp. kistnae]